MQTSTFLLFGWRRELCVCVYAIKGKAHLFKSAYINEENSPSSVYDDIKEITAVAHTTTAKDVMWMGEENKKQFQSILVSGAVISRPWERNLLKNFFIDMKLNAESYGNQIKEFPARNENPENEKLLLLDGKIPKVMNLILTLESKTFPLFHRQSFPLVLFCERVEFEDFYKLSTSCHPHDFLTLPSLPSSTANSSFCVQRESSRKTPKLASEREHAYALLEHHFLVSVVGGLRLKCLSWANLPTLWYLRSCSSSARPGIWIFFRNFDVLIFYETRELLKFTSEDTYLFVPL